MAMSDRFGEANQATWRHATEPRFSLPPRPTPLSRHLPCGFLRILTVLFYHYGALQRTGIITIDRARSSTADHPRLLYEASDAASSSGDQSKYINREG